MSWYFADRKDNSARGILPARDMEQLVAMMGCELEKLNIWEANWNGTEFIRGIRIGDFPEPVSDGT